MAPQRPSAARIEAGHELTASGAGGGQVLVSLGQAFAELLVLLGKAGHLLLELADVIGLSETGLAPDLLAESIGEAVLKLADAGCQAGGAFVGGNGLQRDKVTRTGTEKTARIAENSQLASRFRRWCQVLCGRCWVRTNIS